MYIVKKRKIHPIIIPLTGYVNRWNDSDSYTEMNTTMNIDEEGDVVILIRTVNYRKCKNKSSVTFGTISNSIYGMLKGKIVDDFNLEDFEFTNVNIYSDIPRYTTWWLGLEDIRFIDKNTVLCCIPECNKDGVPSLFKGNMLDNTLHSLVECYPNVNEKNWMPFKDEDKDKVIYSVSPFIIKSVIEDEKEYIKLDEELENTLKNWHGSTNGIKWNNKLLFFIHKNIEDKVIHKCVLYDTRNKKVEISKDFIFFKNSFIEFVCSLSHYKDILYVGMGVNDSKGFIIEIEKAEILKLFI